VSDFLSFSSNVNPNYSSMKITTIPSRRMALTTILPILAIGLIINSSSAQTVLVDWNHTWNYMHPTTGALPAGSGATEPNSGATKWYAPKAAFDASYTGPSFTTSGTGYEAGATAGPLGYGALDYWTNATTAVPPVVAEFTALGTTLTTPASGVRYTGYFRTTFTVPNDGSIYANPTLTGIIDDGAFIYLDGVLVSRVNVGTLGAAGVADTYTGLAANTTNTESGIRTFSLNIAPLSSTGSGFNPTAPATAFVLNTTGIARVSNLAPGVHTLAVSTHNQANNSSDIAMALKLVASPVNCSINASASAVRVDNLTPDIATDDTVTVTLTVTSTGTVSPSGWKITAPPAVAGQTGAYNTPVVIPGVPLATFTNGSLSATFEDADTALCTTTASVTIPLAIGVNTLAANAVILTDGAPISNWVMDETLLTSTQNSATQADHIVDSQLINLSSIGYAQLTASLDAITGTSSGFELADRFYMQVFIDGSTTPISVLGTADSNSNGYLEGADAADLTGGTELPGNVLTSTTKPFSFSYLIPASANSVKIRFIGNSNSGSETFLVKNLKLEAPPAGIVVTVGTVTIDNKGTDTATDDTFGAPVLVDGISLSPSTGWNSDRVDPDQGTYGATVNFFADVAVATMNATLTDKVNNTVSKEFNFGVPAQTFDATAATAIVRNEGASSGIADDTVTFTTTISSGNAGPKWKASVPAPYTISALTGSYGAVNFTVGNVGAGGNVVVTLEDISYPALTKALTVAMPTRYVVGKKDLGGGVVDVLSTFAPSASWTNATAYELHMNSSPATAQTVESETLDLSALGDVLLTAKLDPTETSDGSNFETTDKFKIELVLTTGATTETINLITAHDAPLPPGDAARWDKGAGITSTVAPGVDGAPDGWINGYDGTAGTDFVTNTAYATAILEYNANAARDEFNRNGVPVTAWLNNTTDAVKGVGGLAGAAYTFDFSYTIPASVDSAKLVITGVGAGGTETLIVKDVLFSFPPVGPVDTDGDGMSDDYEIANGLNPNSNADKLTDKDGDGQANCAEFLAGTAANDPNSTLKILDIVPSGVANVYNVSVATVVGKKYQLRESSDLGAADAWANYGAVFTATAATTVVPINVTGLGDKHFVEVKVVP
jgi:hypothetical protein